MSDLGDKLIKTVLILLVGFAGGIVIFLCVSLIVCFTRPERPPITVELAKAGGCIVYEIKRDFASNVYTTVCPQRIRTEWDEHHGKVTERVSEETVNQ